jgi:hypothetical protein
MPLAAPLILPFAELAGITIAGLGMAAASKKVSDFISDNPEISTQILTTLVPGGVGLNALFKDKDAPSTKDIVLGELGKEKGNYSSPNAEGAYSSKRGRIIKALEEAGKIKKGPDKDYDSSKKYKGYKKFYEKADGGSIGTGGTPYDAIATTQDFTNALDKVGAGTDLQKAVAIGEYGQNARRQNPFKNLGFLDTQRHFDNNQLLKNAVSRGELSSADYNRLGGFDVAQTMGAGNPVLGGIGNLIGSTGYNIVQSLKGNQSPFDIPGDVFRNVQGGTGLISDDLKTQYENIINSSTPTPNASTDRPTMADVAGPGTSNNLLSLFERYKDIQTPAGADPNNPDFVGETALGNIEKGVKGFLTSDRGLKYGKDIPLDINDIYSFIEAQRRSFSPDLSQNYQGGDLYHYLQDFYQYKYGNPRIELPSGNYGYYDEQGPDGPVSNERENIFKSYFNQPYKYGLKDGGRIGFANGGRGYSDYASPSSTTASQDFATQAVSGGQTDYDGGGGGNDQPITEIRPNFNYNIDPFSINPRLNFKNIASIIYLQEFLDKKARGEDPNLEADINFRDQLGNLGIFGNLGRSGNIVGANIPFLQSGLASLAYNTDTGLAAGLRGNLTEDLSGGVSFQDGQQNVNFNYNKGPFSADFTSGPEENNIQVGFKMPFADGGRIGFANGGDSIINKDLISLFRGQPLFGQTTNQALSSYPSDKMLSGRFFTTDPDIAKSYAKNSSFPSVVKEMKVPQNVLDKAYDFKNRLTNFSTKTFADLPQRKDVLIASKDMLKNYKPSINIPATLSSNFNQGLGFLKNNAIKGLTTLGSLPVQAALATLYPTPANADEVNMNPEDFKNDQILQPNVVPERIAPATYYNSAPNFNADVLREEEDAQYNLPQKNMLQNLKDYLPFIGDKSITGMLTRGIGQFFNNIGDRIPSTPQYQQYTPGYNYGNLNPNLIDDFYDPATGLNRFDRAKTLFGQSRTLSEFLSKRRERAAAEADLVQRREIERKLEREKALARNTSSNIDYGGFVSGGGTHSSDSSFTGHSSATGGGMGQSGWGGPRADGGFIGQYSNGGLATMFRRKQ